ncbi:benzoate/H(+) symporter BenE family transporter [Aeromicrobium sp. CF4.19]|uniref:benzoate/H(+) symporter BenE family transporter n=1 Tax=Aeromicrobium sp. CF4.19 TaxID=3373082 RepID=UPI003EE6EF9E
MRQASLQQPIVAGLVASLVGFTSSFAVVLAGLKAVGATDDQAASGLLALSVVFGLGMIGLGLVTRSPVTLAWSTPGAALLVSTGPVEGGWPAAVGAFVLTGVLLALTGVVPLLGRLAASIPVPLAQAMLAGVLLQLCLAPFTALAETPAAIGPVIVVWLLAMRWAPRWAVPLALVAALAAIAVSVWSSGARIASADLVPRVEVTSPTLTVAAVVGIAVPLTIVTMASQNVPGVAVMRTFGFAVPWRGAMLTTGIGTSLAAFLGGHAMNLAALSAALAAGEEAGERSRRWIAAVTAGGSYLLLALVSGALVAVTAAAPPGVVETVAGLALLATFATSIVGALSASSSRTGAIVTFLVAASGVQVLGVGAAFWALVLGLLVRMTIERRAPENGEEGPDGQDERP